MIRHVYNCIILCVIGSWSVNSLIQKVQPVPGRRVCTLQTLQTSYWGTWCPCNISVLLSLKKTNWQDLFLFLFQVHIVTTACNVIGVWVSCIAEVLVQVGDDVIKVRKFGGDEPKMTTTLYLNGDLTPGVGVYSSNGGNSLQVCRLKPLWNKCCTFINYNIYDIVLTDQPAKWSLHSDSKMALSECGYSYRILGLGMYTW